MKASVRLGLFLSGSAIAAIAAWIARAGNVRPGTGNACTGDDRTRGNPAADHHAGDNHAADDGDGSQANPNGRPQARSDRDPDARNRGACCPRADRRPDRRRAAGGCHARIHPVGRKIQSDPRKHPAEDGNDFL
jgi:hypothetical protein